MASPLGWEAADRMLRLTFKTNQASYPWTKDGCRRDMVSDELVKCFLGCTLRTRTDAYVCRAGEVGSSLAFADDPRPGPRAVAVPGNSRERSGANWVPN
jgi:hypothetical protein